MMQDMTGARPLPEETPLTAPFWQAAREHRLVIQRCTACADYILINIKNFFINIQFHASFSSRHRNGLQLHCIHFQFDFTEILIKSI